MPAKIYFTDNEIFNSNTCQTQEKGHCQDMKVRLEQHNSGRTKSTKAFIPWELEYFECFETRNEAITRERYFKTAAGRKFIKSKLKHIE